MACDVCGSYEHADHIDCSYCGSSRHIVHPVCSECGSYAHEHHPIPRCNYCGSYDHEDHPRCRDCGDYDHEIHPRCPVCGDDAHTNHEELYLKETQTDIAIYWTTLRVFTKKLSALLDELTNDSTWTTVKRDRAWPGDDEPDEVRVTDRWELGLKSTTNTLAALLKVDLNFSTTLEPTITRDRMNDAKRIAFARDLVALSGGLLADFEAYAANPRVRDE